MICLVPITGEVSLILSMMFQMDLLSKEIQLHLLFQVVMQVLLSSYDLSPSEFHFTIVRFYQAVSKVLSSVILFYFQHSWNYQLLSRCHTGKKGPHFSTFSVKNLSLSLLSLATFLPIPSDSIQQPA